MSWFQGITRNRTRMCLGVTGAEMCRQLKEFLTRAGSTGMAHIHNLGENRGVSMASVWAVIA